MKIAWDNAISFLAYNSQRVFVKRIRFIKPKTKRYGKTSSTKHRWSAQFPCKGIFKTRMGRARKEGSKNWGARKVSQFVVLIKVLKSKSKKKDMLIVGNPKLYL